mgnify:CR=1 FL=1
MPRLVFNNLEEFEKWIKDFAKPDRYVAYITTDQEHLLVPLRSTRPIIYAYYKGEETTKIKNLLDSIGIKHYTVQAIEWADDRPVGFKWKEIE